MMKKRAVHVYEGDSHKYYKRKNGAAVVIAVCCDCGLSHVEEFMPRKAYIRVRVWRDEKETKKFRGKRRIVGTK